MCVETRENLLRSSERVSNVRGAIDTHTRNASYEDIVRGCVEIHVENVPMTQQLEQRN